MRPQRVHGHRALRLTFRYEGDRVELVSSQPVEMTLPPSHPLGEAEGQSGFWFTVRTVDGKPLYRRVMHPPIRTDAEVFSPEAAENIKRVPVSRPQGTFVLVVPDLEAGETVTLHMHPVEPGAQALPAREIGHFRIREPGGKDG